VLCGCTPVVVSGHNLAWSTWKATSVDGVAPITGSEPTISFDGDSVHVFGGCGRRGSGPGAPARVIEERLVLPEMLGDLSMCLANGGTTESPVMPIEDTFFRILLSNDHINVVDGVMVITSPSGEIILEPASSG
jgi:hypothetical protein